MLLRKTYSEFEDMFWRATRGKEVGGNALSQRFHGQYFSSSSGDCRV